LSSPKSKSSNRSRVPVPTPLSMELKGPASLYFLLKKKIKTNVLTADDAAVIKAAELAASPKVIKSKIKKVLS